MSFKIQYSLDQTYQASRNLSNCDEMYLRYNFFPGSIILSHFDKLVNLDWNWIPLLDFAYSIAHICNEFTFNKSLKEEFDFTDSDAVLVFSRIENDKIYISTSYSDEKISVNIKSFEKEVKDFYLKMVSDIVERYPELVKNEHFKKFNIDPF